MGCGSLAFTLRAWSEQRLAPRYWSSEKGICRTRTPTPTRLPGSAGRCPASWKDQARGY